MNKFAGLLPETTGELPILIVMKKSKFEEEMGNELAAYYTNYLTPIARWYSDLKSGFEKLGEVDNKDIVSVLTGHSMTDIIYSGGQPKGVNAFHIMDKETLSKLQEHFTIVEVHSSVEMEKAVEEMKNSHYVSPSMDKTLIKLKDGTEMERAKVLEIVGALEALQAREDGALALYAFGELLRGKTDMGSMNARSRETCYHAGLITSEYKEYTDEDGKKSFENFYSVDDDVRKVAGLAISGGYRAPLQSVMPAADANAGQAKCCVAKKAPCP